MPRTREQQPVLRRVRAPPLLLPACLCASSFCALLHRKEKVAENMAKMPELLQQMKVSPEA